MKIKCGANDLLETYLDLYTIINTESLTSEDVLNIQEVILRCLDEIKSLKLKKQTCQMFSWDDYEYYFRSLVNNMLCIYYFDGDIYEVSRLSTDTKKYNSYNSTLVHEYIELSKEWIEEDNTAYFFISDLCVG